jgi:hypothetical protein
VVQPHIKSALLLTMLVVAGCANELSATLEPTPRLAALTPFPAEAIRAGIATNMQIGIERLTPAEQDQVTTNRDAAVRTALASRGVGVPGPNGRGEIAWTSTGFVYLVSYVPPVGPGSAQSQDRSPIAAYLVQVLAPPIPGYPGFNSALVVVDARSGDLITTVSPCNGPKCRPQ